MYIWKTRFDHGLSQEGYNLFDDYEMNGDCEDKNGDVIFIMQFENPKNTYNFLSLSKNVIKEDSSKICHEE